MKARVLKTDEIIEVVKDGFDDLIYDWYYRDVYSNEIYEATDLDFEDFTSLSEFKELVKKANRILLERISQIH